MARESRLTSWKNGVMGASASPPNAAPNAAPIGPVDSLLRWVQLGTVAILAMVVGYVSATGGLSLQLVLISLPLLVLAAGIILKRPLLLGMLFLPIFYSNIEGIAGLKTGLPTAVVLFIVSLAYYALLAFSGKLRMPLPRSSRLFLLFFAVCLATATLIPWRDDAAYGEWIRIMLYSLSAFVMSHVVLVNQEQFRKLIILLTWTGVMLSVVNLIEFFDRSLINLSSVASRSAGLLQNANPSASAILACYLLSYFTPQRFMLPARVIMFLGIYTTFSRAGLIMFFMFLFFNELVAVKITLRRTLVSISLIATVVLMAAFGRFIVDQSNNKQVAQAYNRIVRIVDGSFDDESSNQRRRVIPIHLKRFEEHPLVGSGGGATRGPDSPHNQLLLIMVEHGLAGTLLFLLFLIESGRRIWRMPDTPEKRLMIALYVYQILNMAVTHNQLHYRFYIQVFALMCIGPELFSRAQASSPEPSPVPPSPVLPPPEGAPSKARLQLGGGVA